MADDAGRHIPLRVQGAVYASGYLSTSTQNMLTLVLPLWVVATFETSAFMIGVVIGARGVLPTLLSIHGGAMMDRLGAKRVMMAFAVVGMVVPVLYPVSPSIWAVVVLQMLSGLANTMSWVGAQTLIGQVMKGSATHSGRLGSAALIGNLTVPPIIGATWDHLGPWAAFLLISFWAAGLFVAASLLPAPPQETAPGRDRLRARDFIPRLSSYVEAFALLAVPAIAVVVIVSVLRNTAYAVRGSFYVVYLESIGISGTEIGFLMSAAGLVGAGAALLAGRITEFVAPVVLMFVTVAGTIIFICMPPLMANYWQLMVLAGFWGASAGMGMPLMFSIMAKSVDERSQGKSVGVRITANRFTSMLLPVIMGAVADGFGVSASFFIVGAAMLAALGALALYARRVMGAGR